MDAPLRALIIDSWFDPYHGAVVMMRIFDGADSQRNEDSDDVQRQGL